MVTLMENWWLRPRAVAFTSEWRALPQAKVTQEGFVAHGTPSQKATLGPSFGEGTQGHLYSFFNNPLGLLAAVPIKASLVAAHWCG